MNPSNTPKSLKLFYFLFLLLFGCNFNATYNNRVEDKNEAEKVADKFYSLIRKTKYQDTYKLFGKKFFQVTDTSKLDDIFQFTYTKLGAIDNMNLDHWQTQIIKGTNPSSNYALYFLVQREKYLSKETITLDKENDSIKIIGYYVNSDGLFARDSTK